MSYILDALRRADAEREREKGGVPGLHARPLTAASAPEAAAPARQQGLWLALGVSIGLLAALGWWVLGRPPAAPAAPPAAPMVQAVPVPVPVPVPVLAQAPLAEPAALSVPAPAPAPETAARAPAPLPAAAPLPATAPAPAPAPSPRAAPAPAVPPVPTADSPASPLPAASVAATPRAVPLAQLSADLRREMPAMTVGGSVYSESAASRFVIINGQVVREGEGAATGVTVERIGPKSAVLRWRDMRIEVPL